MEHIYTALFKKNDDGSYTVTYPDLPGCISEGKDLASAVRMAQSALSQWLAYLTETGKAIPQASEPETIKSADGQVAALISAELKDTRAVKRTVSLPRWMDEAAINAGLSLSRILQDALSKTLGNQ